MPTVYSTESVDVSAMGHFYKVRALTPTEIPECLLEHALAAGCRLADTSATAPEGSEKATARAKLATAVQYLLDNDDDPEHFKLDGTPTVFVVAKTLGVSSRDVKPAAIYDVYAEIVTNRRLAEPNE